MSPSALWPTDGRDRASIAVYPTTPAERCCHSAPHALWTSTRPRSPCISRPHPKGEWKRKSRSTARKAGLLAALSCQATMSAKMRAFPGLTTMPTVARIITSFAVGCTEATGTCSRAECSMRFLERAGVDAMSGSSVTTVRLERASYLPTLRDPHTPRERFAADQRVAMCIFNNGYTYHGIQGNLGKHHAE